MTLAILLATQVLTFVLLGIHFLADGDWRLGSAQLLLAIIQAIIYSGGLHG